MVILGMVPLLDGWMPAGWRAAIAARHLSRRGNGGGRAPFTRRTAPDHDVRSRLAQMQDRCFAPPAGTSRGRIAAARDEPPPHVARGNGGSRISAEARAVRLWRPWPRVH